MFQSWKHLKRWTSFLILFQLQEDGGWSKTFKALSFEGSNALRSSARSSRLMSQTLHKAARRQRERAAGGFWGAAAPSLLHAGRTSHSLSRVWSQSSASDEPWSKYNTETTDCWIKNSQITNRKTVFIMNSGSAEKNLRILLWEKAWNKHKSNHTSVPYACFSAGSPWESSSCSVFLCGRRASDPAWRSRWTPRRRRRLKHQKVRSHYRETKHNINKNTDTCWS